MKLSEAIRMNEMMKPQGFGSPSMHSSDAPCALGGALQVVGKAQHISQVITLWPWVAPRYHTCPACPNGWIKHEELRFGGGSSQGVTIIWHLNDAHRWTRQQIADWVASVEPQEEQTPVVHALEEIEA